MVAMLTSIPYLLRRACGQKSYVFKNISRSRVFKIASPYNNCKSRLFNTSHALKEKSTVSATFLDKEGDKLCTVTGPEGSSLYDLLENSIEDINGFGSCEGELLCTSCHVVLSPEDYHRVPDKLGDEENDLLSELSAGSITETSRLGCQVRVTKELNGISVLVPD